MADILVRRPSFAERLATLPKYFAGDGDLFVSHVVAALSSQFPDGEDFFVRSVRHYRNQITDPKLLADVNAFIGQEAVHGREHRALNRRLTEMGYPAVELEDANRRLIKFRERLMSPMANLAMTAAIEHFTASFATFLMSRPDARAALGDSLVTDVLMWHSIEEAEHKSVVYNVYQQVGGTEKQRIRMNKILLIGGIPMTLLTVIWSILQDRDSYRNGRLLKSLRGLRSNPLLSGELWSLLWAYNRVGFTPDEIPTEELVTEWRWRLFGEGDPERYPDVSGGSIAALSTAATSST